MVNGDVHHRCTCCRQHVDMHVSYPRTLRSAASMWVGKPAMFVLDCHHAERIIPQLLSGGAMPGSNPSHPPTSPTHTLTDPMNQSMNPMSKPLDLPTPPTRPLTLIRHGIDTLQRHARPAVRHGGAGSHQRGRHVA